MEKRRTILVRLSLEVPAEMDDGRAVALLNKLLDVGAATVAAADKLPGIPDLDARDAAAITVGPMRVVAHI